ncbi:hypothetical protein JL09_g3596 [Pichia kudriavzevii]|uniref:Major facilitator superfamily (MFS) profile domain-containing protein n=1 Tax=Pichia kudriavzevii TaxID=4909 RepID=A0A099NZI7_PICKU|nr:hypothetical protein JL09_g3596 [Pichia kudriavzevii]
MVLRSLSETLKKEITWGKKNVKQEEYQRFEVSGKDGITYTIEEHDIAPTGKKDYWPIFTAGAGLFSDGYVNNSIGTVGTCLSTIYGAQYSHSNAIKNVAAIAFAGTVVGQLTFGVFSDHISRKLGMLVSSGGLIVFSILTAGSWGVGTEAKYGGNAGGLFAALTAWRFFLGFFIGAEYPTGSTACAEASALLPEGKRHRYFAWFTNLMLASGYVLCTFVPMVLLWICGPKNLQPVWRITLGIGAIPPTSLFIMRLFFTEGKQFQKLNFRKSKMPVLLTIKYYWFRLLIVSIVWWIYDFISYAFSIYSTTILKSLIKDGSLYKTFGWNVVFSLFGIPGAFIGAFLIDYFGPRLTLCLGLVLQATVGYIMAGLFSHLREHIAAFVVVYGIFSTLGQVGAGNNIGLLAAKTSATPVRGVYYGIAAAIGKIGAFVGTYVFPTFQRHYPGTKGFQIPFWLASSLAIFAAIISFFGLPPVDQEAMQREDFDYLRYLSANGFDISTLGDGTFLKSNNITPTSSFDREYLEIGEDEKK